MLDTLCLVLMGRIHVSVKQRRAGHMTCCDDNITVASLRNNKLVYTEVAMVTCDWR